MLRTQTPILVAPEGVGEEELSKKKRRRTGGTSELTDQDPAIIHNIRNAGNEYQMQIFETLEAFVESISVDPAEPAVARMTKNTIRKVLNALW